LAYAQLGSADMQSSLKTSVAHHAQTAAPQASDAKWVDDWFLEEDVLEWSADRQSVARVNADDEANAATPHALESENPVGTVVVPVQLLEEYDYVLMCCRETIAKLACPPGSSDERTNAVATAAGSLLTQPVSMSAPKVALSPHGLGLAVPAGSGSPEQPAGPASSSELRAEGGDVMARTPVSVLPAQPEWTSVIASYEAELRVKANEIAWLRGQMQSSHPNAMRTDGDLGMVPTPQLQPNADSDHDGALPITHLPARVMARSSFAAAFPDTSNTQPTDLSSLNVHMELLPLPDASSVVGLLNKAAIPPDASSSATDIAVPVSDRTVDHRVLSPQPGATKRAGLSVSLNTCRPRVPSHGNSRGRLHVPAVITSTMRDGRSRFAKSDSGAVVVASTSPAASSGTIQDTIAVVPGHDHQSASIASSEEVLNTDSVALKDDARTQDMHHPVITIDAAHSSHTINRSFSSERGVADSKVLILERSVREHQGMACLKLQIHVY